MRNFLSNALLLHWTVVFAALALLCALEPEAGLRAPLDLLGLNAAAADPAFALRSSALFGSAFLLAALVAWTLGEETRGRPLDASAPR